MNIFLKNLSHIEDSLTERDCEWVMYYSVLLLQKGGPCNKKSISNSA